VCCRHSRSAAPTVVPPLCSCVAAVSAPGDERCHRATPPRLLRCCARLQHWRCCCRSRWVPPVWRCCAKQQTRILRPADVASPQQALALPLLCSCMLKPRACCAACAHVSQTHAHVLRGIARVSLCCRPRVMVAGDARCAAWCMQWRWIQQRSAPAVCAVNRLQWSGSCAL
jgi:hypothetical protein